MLAREAVKVCVDRVLPADVRGPATDRAIAEREGNAVDAGRLGEAMARLEEFVGGDQVKREALVMLSGKRLRTGRTLKVYFMGSWPQWAIDRVMYYMNLWEDAANIQWERTTDIMASDVRI